MKQGIYTYQSATAAWLLMTLTCFKLCSLMLMFLYLHHQPSGVYHMLSDADEVHSELHIHDFEKKVKTIKTGPVV